MTKMIKAIIAIGIVSIAFYSLSIYSLSSISSVKEDVASEMVKNYKTAEKIGDKVQMEVQAGMCEAAYIQANDADNAKKWHDIKISLDKELGIQ